MVSFEMALRVRMMRSGRLSQERMAVYGHAHKIIRRSMSLAGMELCIHSNSIWLNPVFLETSSSMNMIQAYMQSCQPPVATSQEHQPQTSWSYRHDGKCRAALWLPYYIHNTHSEFYGPIISNQDPQSSLDKGLNFRPFAAGLQGMMTTHGAPEEAYQEATVLV